jgi:diacylglycerol kinase family enzyme
MKALVVVNQKAGGIDGQSDSAHTQALRDEFHSAGIDVALRLAAAKEIAPALKAAIAERPEALFVAGGDGTISTAAGLLVDTGIPLGIVPLGTLNHFARDLGLPVTRREAIVALAHGQRTSVDVGEVNGRVFINNCSIGSYPEAVRKRDMLRRTKGAGKWTAMLVASVSVFRRLRRMRLRIESTDAKAEVRTPFMLVANNRYCGNLFNDCLRPRLNDGLLFIYTTRAHRRLTLLRLAWQSLTRTIDGADELDARAVVAATITSVHGEPLPIAVDGELAELSAPLRFRVRPGALRVIMPEQKPGRPARVHNSAEIPALPAGP